MGLLSDHQHWRKILCWTVAYQSTRDGGPQQNVHANAGASQTAQAAALCKEDQLHYTQVLIILLRAWSFVIPTRSYPCVVKAGWCRVVFVTAEDSKVTREFDEGKGEVSTPGAGSSEEGVRCTAMFLKLIRNAVSLRKLVAASLAEAAEADHVPGEPYFPCVKEA